MMKTLLFFLTSLISISASADNSWGTYHWARESSSFELELINSTTSNWDDYVTQAVGDWSASPEVTLVEDTNGGTSKKIRRQCRAPKGGLRICNLAYGQTGWLGIAGISLDANGHISQGYTKLNDSYFSLSYYDKASWKQSVTCQELGHNLGLDHQDEDFDNKTLFSCMDYQDPPFPYPNGHDYQQIADIYGHSDSYDSYSQTDEGSSSDGGSCNAPKGKGCNKANFSGNNGEIGWGNSLGRRGNSEVFLRVDHNGIRHLTHVTWAKGH
ncbi:hypothetical protein [Colwellia piezophila]|uniref:hypothetical protein n=1 Tax=Colwellia piezophila TaxID=211668 RepID=UPI0012F733C1|nr:hypothetical protein [Colwellia piezophila]